LPGPRPSSGKRLHPAAIGVWVIEAVSRFGLGAIPLLVVEPESVFLLLGLLGLSVLASAIRYLRFSYRIDRDALVVQGGLLNTWRRVIPLPRIQSIDVVEKLRHRLFGIVELRIEAAGGRQTEAALVAISPSEAERLRAALLVGHRHPLSEEQSPPLARLGPGLLVLAGITGGRVAIIAGLLGYMGELAPEELLFDLFDRLGQAGTAGLALLVVALIAFLALSLIISIVGTILVYWDFTLQWENDRVVVTRGLLERRRAVVPLGRLQALRLEENLVRLPFGLASVRAVTAGFSGRSEEEKETSVLLPIGSRSQALAIVAKLMGTPPGQLPAQLEPATRRALARRVIFGIVLGLAAGLTGFFLWGPGGTAGFILLPIGALLGLAQWRALGHATDETLAVSRSGALVRKTMFVPLANLQHIGLRASPDQRLLYLGTVRMEIPGGSARAIDVPRPQAEQLFDLLTAKMVRSVASL
jgi:putative membrane protein